jgi:prevent-host-death family protein
LVRKVSIEQLALSLRETVEQVDRQDESVVIERDGKPIAAVVSIREYESMRRSEDRFWELFNKNWDANRDVDSAELDAVIEQAVQEVRRERRLKNATVSD